QTLELCAIPSETAQEKAIADHVEAFCRRLGGDGSVVRIGNSVICDPWGGKDGTEDLPTVALVGHLDTVKCAEGQPTEIRAGKVYGCGASDMKGGVATMMVLLEEWASLRSGRPVWIFYDREEGPHEEN